MNRTKGILIAASLTGLVLVTVLALGLGRAVANSNDAAAVPPSGPESSTTGTSQNDLQQQIEAWQQYSQKLEQTVRIMQERETQYQQQLTSANQTIVQLQNELNSRNSLQPRFFFGEREGNESGAFDD
jgi:peptidoglycan hydrolase CwlO-like protein